MEKHTHTHTQFKGPLRDVLHYYVPVTRDYIHIHFDIARRYSTKSHAFTNEFIFILHLCGTLCHTLSYNRSGHT